MTEKEKLQITKFCERKNYYRDLTLYPDLMEYERLCEEMTPQTALAQMAHKLTNEYRIQKQTAKNLIVNRIDSQKTQRRIRNYYE